MSPEEHAEAWKQAIRWVCPVCQSENDIHQPRRYA